MANVANKQGGVPDPRVLAQKGREGQGLLSDKKVSSTRNRAGTKKEKARDGQIMITGSNKV